jgi:hypothetical protein
MRLMATVLVSLLITAAANGSDLYVVQGNATGPQLDDRRAVLWTTNAVFFNGGASDATIRLLNVSNHGHAVAPGLATLRPERTGSLDALGLFSAGTSDPLWVLHLDAPPTVDVNDALFIGETSFSGPSPGTFPYAYGKIVLPVFRSLIPAGQRQVHLMTSLGPASNIPSQVQVSSRINVAIYNSASTAANATIEIRQHCDDQIVATRTVSIPADTIVQVGSFAAQTANCGESGLSQLSLFVYTVVTVDQPSFSFVSNLSNAVIPTTSMSITP